MTLPIYYVTNSAPASGVGVRAHALVQELRRYPEVVTVVPVLLDGNERRLVWADQAEDPLSSLPGFLDSKSVTWMRLGRSFGRKLRQADRGVVDYTNQTLSFLVDSTVPSVVTVHDLIELQEPQSWAGAALARYLYKGISRATHIVAVSHFTAQVLQDTFAIPAERISVVYNGVRSGVEPLENFHASVGYYALVKEFSLPSDAPIILTVGSDHSRKNLTTVAKVFSKILEEYPEAVWLKVGAPGILAGRQHLLSELDALGIRSQVRFIDTVTNDRLNELYNLADILLHPSHFEGFGLPPLEAMAAGLPVITSTATSLPEVVGDGKAFGEQAALLCEADDVSAISEAALTLLNDKEAASAWRAKGLARAQKFSWALSAKQLLDIYMKVSS